MKVCSHAWDSSRALKMNVDTKYVIVLGIGSAYQKNKKKSRCSLKKGKFCFEEKEWKKSRYFKNVEQE